jgi:ubiquinone/menaquinone biosynthesis C-methylase UbiE
MLKMISKMLASVVLVAALGIALTAQDDERDTAWLIKVLQAKPGSVLADIGAGPQALLTIPMARHVGPSGRVYATELGAQSLEKLRAVIQNANVPNVQIVAGDPLSTNLPPECCDAIFVRYVYHHFADPPRMNASLRQSLRPGGTLAIIEFAPRGREAPIPGDRAGDDTHGVGAEPVARELQHAGFELVTSEQRADRLVLVVARRAK